MSLEVIIETLESVGMNKLITFDLHSIKIPELFKIPIVHLSALPIFAQKIKEIIFSDFKNSILVSPDMGGIRRIKILSEMLSDMPYISIVKDRDLETGNIKSNKIDTNLPDFKKKSKELLLLMT